MYSLKSLTRTCIVAASIISSFAFLTGCAGEDKPVPATDAADTTVTSDFKQAFDRMSWILGSWEGRFEGTVYYERWSRPNDTSLQNITFVLQGADTLVTSTAAIRIIDNTIYYSNLPEDELELIKWKLKDLGDKLMHFENAAAPYTQEVIFEQGSPQTIMTKLVGETDTLTQQLRKLQ